MPTDCIKYKDKKMDGRVKILPSKYPEIREYYKEVKSQRKTAKHFGVSRKLIVFILYPERYKRQLKRRREKKVHLKYYDRERHTKAMRKYRAKKRKYKLIKTRKVSL